MFFKFVFSRPQHACFTRSTLHLMTSRVNWWQIWDVVVGSSASGLRCWRQGEWRPSELYSCHMVHCLKASALQLVCWLWHWRRGVGDIQKKRGRIWDLQRGSGPVWPVLSAGRRLCTEIWHCDHESTFWHKTQPRYVSLLISDKIKVDSVFFIPWSNV